ALLIAVLGNAAGDFFGEGVAGLGDVNGDGLSDFAVGAPQPDFINKKPGYVTVFSGANGAPLYTVTGGVAEGGLFGRSIGRAGDLNGDGVTDFALGAPFGPNGSGVTTGYVQARSGVNG